MQHKTRVVLDQMGRAYSENAEDHGPARDAVYRDALLEGKNELERLSRELQDTHRAAALATEELRAMKEDLRELFARIDQARESYDIDDELPKPKALHNGMG